MKYHRVKETVPGTVGPYFQWIHFLWINFMWPAPELLCKLTFSSTQGKSYKKGALAMSSLRRRLSMVFSKGVNSWPPGLNLQLKWFNHQQSFPRDKGTPKTQTFLPTPLQLFPQQAPKNVGGNYISIVVSNHFYCSFPSSTKFSWY